MDMMGAKMKPYCVVMVHESDLVAMNKHEKRDDLMVSLVKGATL